MPGKAALERKERKPALPTPRPQASGPQTERKPVPVVPAARLRRLYTDTPAGWWSPWAFPTFSLPIFVGVQVWIAYPGAWWGITGGGVTGRGITGGGVSGGGVTGGGVIPGGNGASLSWPLNTSVGRTGYFVTFEIFSK